MTGGCASARGGNSRMERRGRPSPSGIGSWRSGNFPAIAAAPGLSETATAAAGSGARGLASMVSAAGAGCANCFSNGSSRFSRCVHGTRPCSVPPSPTVATSQPSSSLICDGWQTAEQTYRDQHRDNILQVTDPSNHTWATTGRGEPAFCLSGPRSATPEAEASLHSV